MSDSDCPTSDPKETKSYFSEQHAGSDLALEVEGKQLHVHKQVLRVVSAVFDAMFSSDFVEKDAETVPLPGKKSDDIEKLLRVIYPCFRERIHGELLGVAFHFCTWQEFLIPRST